MRKKLLLVFPLLFLTGLFSCHVGSQKKDIESKRPSAMLSVEGYVVRPSLLIETIEVSGTLKPFEETVLMPEVGGRVVLANLPEGKFVKKGTLLVKLFDGELQAQLKKAQTQLQLAEQTEKRQGELLKVSGISQFDYDQTVFQVNSIKDDIELLNVQIGKTELVAPFDGVIGLKNISVGAQVTTATSLVTIRNINRLKIDFSVPEKYSREIIPGKKILYTVEGDTLQYDAEVIATEEGIESTTRNLKVRAVDTHPTPSLKPGSFARVLMELNQHPNALMVPTQAIIMQARGKKIIVARNGKAEFIPVKTGIRKESTIEILNGIHSGDTVVITGIVFLKPNSDLKFSKVIK
ncbi:MAG: efflux RND transporter periplasmic adaptor subunit [Bacteroidetes bacterium]|nr:efflux RND transporter periplasmic adaptor subunit [Bacteroidota bacterium]